MLNLQGKLSLLAATILTAVTTTQAADMKPLTRTPSVERLVVNNTKAKLKEMMRAELATLQKETKENSEARAQLKHNIEELKKLILEDLRAILIGKNIKKWSWSREAGLHNLTDVSDALLESTIIPALTDILDTYPSHVSGTPLQHDAISYMEKTTLMPNMIPTAAEKDFKQHKMANEGMVHYFVKMNLSENNVESLPELLAIIEEAETNLDSKKNKVAELALSDKEKKARINEIEMLMTR